MVIRKYIYFESGVIMKKITYVLTSVLTAVVLMCGFTASAAAFGGTADALPTGDGRIYTAVGVLAVAIIVVVLMIVFRKKDGDDE